MTATVLARARQGVQALEDLETAQNLADAAHRAVHRAVAAARKAGWSWACIAEALGRDESWTRLRYRREGIN